MSDTKETERAIAAVIGANLAFRMMTAIVNPKAYEKNRDDLAEILAADVIKELKKRGIHPHGCLLTTESNPVNVRIIRLGALRRHARPRNRGGFSHLREARSCSSPFMSPLTISSTFSQHVILGVPSEVRYE